MRKGVGTVGTLFLLLCAALGQSEQAPTDAEFAEQLRHLEPQNDKAVRLKALRWINGNSRQPSAARAIPALEKCLREDPEAEVRQQALLDLCLIARRLDKPCPQAVIEALHDKEDVVRYQAVACTPWFKTFTPGSLEVLFRGVKADNAELRSSSLLLLARVAGKDQKALEAIANAKKDSDFDVRHSAHMALFMAKDKLEEHLPYLIRMREDPASVLTPGPEGSEVGKQERAQRNRILLGIAAEMIGWSEARADELAGVLIKLLKDDSAVMRRGAAHLIGASAMKAQLPVQRDADPLTPPSMPTESWFESILPYLDPEAEAKRKQDVKPKEAPQKSKVAQRLETLGVEATLRKLREDDPDRSVRAAARWALERLARVDEKKP
jgi:hypothetical protein